MIVIIVIVKREGRGARIYRRSVIGVWESLFLDSLEPLHIYITLFHLDFGGKRGGNASNSERYLNIPGAVYLSGWLLVVFTCRYIFSLFIYIIHI